MALIMACCAVSEGGSAQAAHRAGGIAVEPAQAEPSRKLIKLHSLTSLISNMSSRFLNLAPSF